MISKYMINSCRYNPKTWLFHILPYFNSILGVILHFQSLTLLDQHMKITMILQGNYSCELPSIVNLSLLLRLCNIDFFIFLEVVRMMCRMVLWKPNILQHFATKCWTEFYGHLLFIYELYSNSCLLFT